MSTLRVHEIVDLSIEVSGIIRKVDIGHRKKPLRGRSATLTIRFRDEIDCIPHRLPDGDSMLTGESLEASVLLGVDKDLKAAREHAVSLVSPHLPFGHAGRRRS